MSESTSWAEQVATTTETVVKGRTELTLRGRVVYKKLLEQGGIKKSKAGGLDLRWGAKNALPEARTFTDGPLGFEPQKKHTKAEIDWRGYESTDAMTLREKLEQSGDGMLIDRYKFILPDLQESIENRIHLAFYADGSSNAEVMQGIETMMTAGTCATGDKVCQPNGSYATIDTDLGVSGTWSTALATKPNSTIATDWPSGTGDSQYDYWSPLMMNWSSTAWVGASNVTWLDTCEKVLREASIWTVARCGGQGRPDICILGDNLMYDFGNRQGAKQQIIVPAKSALDIDFHGFQFAGVDIFTEYGCPANTGYLFSTKQIEFLLLGGKLFHVTGPEFSIERHAWLFAVVSLGNFKFLSPKFVTKLYNYA